MTGVVKRVVSRYLRGVPLEKAMTDFHTHTEDGAEVVLICTRCQSPRIRDNQLSADLIDESETDATYSCLDCSADYTGSSSLEIVSRDAFEKQVLKQCDAEAL